MRPTSLPRLAISMGDPAGIGPELCLRALTDPAVAAVCAPVVVGDRDVLARVAARTGLPFPPVAHWTAAAWDAAGRAGVTGPAVISAGAIDAAAITPGEVAADCGRAAATYVEIAVRAVQAGRADALVTAPLHKEALHLAGVSHPGHTEMLAALTGTSHVAMMLACDELAVSLVTIHIPLAAVPGALTTAGIVDVGRLTAAIMRRLGRARPRLAVCGLNPHAGEHGLFGMEDETVIAPAVAQLRAEGLEVEGPLPPDTAFLPERRGRTDAYLAMYHDQGLIPLKMLAFDRAVNLTLGLPIVRTSVDHGTAFEIAWQGRASANSLREALRWAARLA